jgi:hypothetical protein
MDGDVIADQLRLLEAALWELVERRAATLLPLVEYAPERLSEEVSALTTLADLTLPTRSTLPMWKAATRVPVWHLVYLIGSWAVADGHWTAVRALWTASTTDERPLAAIAQSPAERLGEELVRARPNTSISSEAASLWHLAFRVAGSDFFVERYSELVRMRGEVDPVLSCLSRVGDFSWLVTALAGKPPSLPAKIAGTRGLDIDQWWRASQVCLSLPHRLRANSALAEQLSSQLFLGSTEWLLPDEIDEWVANAGGRQSWD